MCMSETKEWWVILGLLGAARSALLQDWLMKTLMNTNPCRSPSLSPQAAEFEFYDPQSPMYTPPRVLTPSTTSLIINPCHSPALYPQPAEFEFYDPQSPIYTSPRVLPPATIEECKVSDAIIAQGASIKQATISNAVIGLRSTINKGCVIQVRGMCGRSVVWACVGMCCVGMIPFCLGVFKRVQRRS